MESSATSEDFRSIVREAINLSGVKLSGETVMFLAGLLAPAFHHALERMHTQTQEKEEQRRVQIAMLHIPPGKRITPQEHKILRLTARGYTTERIAEELNISPDVVRYRRKSIYIKWGESNPLRAVVQGIHFGLLDTGDLLTPET